MRHGASLDVVPRAAMQRFESRVMGSPLRLVSDAAPSAAERAWSIARRQMETAEDVLSRFRRTSELTALNASAGSGAWIPVSRPLYRMVAMAALAWRITEGRFDARVLGRLEELGEHAAVDVPWQSRPSPGISGIERCPRRWAVRIEAPLDSGGIGKGLGLRWARDAATAVVPRRSGLLIEAGGDITVAGARPGGAAWNVGIEDPAGAGEPVAVIALASGSVATSSTAIRRWHAADGRLVHHLIDPRTGEPGGDGIASVTVAHADPAWAEIWSKALFLTGVSRIGDGARRRGLAAWWVTSEGELGMTPAARSLTLWERSPSHIAAPTR